MGILSMLSIKRQNIKSSFQQNGENQTMSKQNISDKIDYTNEIERIKNKVNNIDNLKDYASFLLSSISKTIEASQCAFFISTEKNDIQYISFLCGFAYHLAETEVKEYEFGEGLSGQVAKERKRVNIKNVPDGYINIISGLGSASPRNLLILPIIENDEVIAVVEIASFKEIKEEEEIFIDLLFSTLSNKIKELKDKI
ncbi:MAG: hypothetical protein A2X12_02755 [Bacteroidetes bacterium GWE2_29_8]|nr:MAG: hypothetical protein A2X12_02755 [Bacteroidetes bacterium GWE2_29_8]OFY20094.1 MAG: hypothetical protein A2X02_06950 [Bacteroidetes bacterium GWF2_29_10]